MEPSAPDRAPPHILVVCSERHVCAVLRAALETNGAYRVTATSARSAAIRTIGRDRPALLLVDLILAKAPGLALATYAIDRHIPVIMMSEDRILARRWEALGCPMLRKPLSIPQLHVYVRQTLTHAEENRRRFRATCARLLENRRALKTILERFGPWHAEALAALEAAREQMSR